MPVKTVELEERQVIDKSQDGGFAEIVAAAVEQDSPPRVAGLVGNLQAGQGRALFRLERMQEELAQGGDAVVKAFAARREVHAAFRNRDAVRLGLQLF